MSWKKILMEELESKVPFLKEYINSLALSITENIDESLLKVTFTHKSFSNDLHKKVDNNERLEFLWDPILGEIISELLFKDYPEWDEDMLSFYKIALVNETTLAIVAKDINLWEHLILGLGERKWWWKEKDSILSDGVEALIAYLYLDMGREVVYEFVKKYVYSKIEEIKEQWTFKNPKSILQEKIQKKYKFTPDYIDGDYKKDSKNNVIMFESKIYVKKKMIWLWYGVSKKSAQTEAAKDALERLN